MGEIRFLNPVKYSIHTYGAWLALTLCLSGVVQAQSLYIASRLQPSGPVSVMAIHARLVKVILEHNPKREFYLEESYPLDLLYPYLSPHGLIFKLDHEPFLKTSSPPIKIIKLSNRSGELVNYSIPYLVSFFVMNLDDTKTLLSFAFFMLIMYWMTLKTHNIFVNPILACLGYNLYDVQYERNGQEREDFFLVKGSRLKMDDRCRILELSEQLFLVTERNPTV